jgi:hypothetical protein
MPGGRQFGPNSKPMLPSFAAAPEPLWIRAIQRWLSSVAFPRSEQFQALLVFEIPEPSEAARILSTCVILDMAELERPSAEEFGLSRDGVARAGRSHFKGPTFPCLAEHSAGLPRPEMEIALEGGASSAVLESSDEHSAGKRRDEGRSPGFSQGCFHRWVR